jgi:hypothetical protein
MVENTQIENNELEVYSAVIANKKAMKKGADIEMVKPHSKQVPFWVRGKSGFNRIRQCKRRSLPEFLLLRFCPQVVK